MAQDAYCYCEHIVYVLINLLPEWRALGESDCCRQNLGVGEDD